MVNAKNVKSVRMQCDSDALVDETGLEDSRDNERLREDEIREETDSQEN